MVSDRIAEATKGAEMPDAWKPEKVVIPDPIEVPDMSDAAWESLAAWHGPNGFYERYRKMLLCSLKQVERAKALANGETLTDGKADDRAHLHPLYQKFIEQGLIARIAYERAFAAKGGLEHV